MKKSLPVRWDVLILPILLFVVFFGCMAIVQFSTPDMPDNDGFYHIKLASLMRSEGLKPDFPWLPLTILNESEFYDHHFLFHIALAPFTFGDLRVGAKWAAVFFASLSFLAIWYLLYKQRIPLSWLWALALLGISEAFLYRMSITRAQSLSLGVLALGLTWLFDGKHLQLAVLSFLYVWLYDAFPLLPILGGLHMAAVLVTERRFEYHPLFFIGVGIILGLLINPYFPQNIIFSFRHMLPKLVEPTVVRVGNEWYPYDTGQLLENSLPILLIFASGIFALGASNRKMGSRTATLLFAALFFGLMLFRARRFIEYFPPFALIFSAFSWSTLFPKSIPGTPAISWSNPPVRFTVVLAGFVMISSFITVSSAQESLRGSKPYDTYRGVSTWLQNNTTEGTRVFQTDWDDFPRLFYYNTHNIYMVGLDPTFMQLYDAELYDLWVMITRGEIEQPSQFIANQFHSQYVHSDLKHGSFLQQAGQDPGLGEVYRDDHSVLFEVVR